MGADTAMSVASEMVEDLSLSHDDARAIAAAIKQEIKQLTGQAPMFSAVDRSVPAHLWSLITARFACYTICILVLRLQVVTSSVMGIEAKLSQQDHPASMLAFWIQHELNNANSPIQLKPRLSSPLAEVYGQVEFAL